MKEELPNQELRWGITFMRVGGGVGKADLRILYM